MQILKIDDEQRIVYGWASVISKNGKAVVDLQGDIVESSELEKATADFMLESRRGQAMHLEGKTGDIVHSFPLTKGIMDTLGISSEQEGWVVGYKVHSDEVWKSVKEGKLGAFSFGGEGIREEVDGN